MDGTLVDNTPYHFKSWQHLFKKYNMGELSVETYKSKGKPNPQIFLKAAADLNANPADCVVFEDSLAGIKAANAAGMKVVGITTGHPAADLQPSNLVIDDYSTLTVQKLAALFEKD